METHQVKCCDEETWVSLGLFTDVSNASWLRNEATSGRMEAALLDSSLIGSSFQVLAAVNKALMLREQQQMRTKSVYSEIIFSLSPSTNMKGSFKSFGIKDTSRTVLAVTVDSHSQQSEDRLSQIVKQVEGRMVPLTDLHSLSQQEEIIKLYKISPEELNISSLENAVVTKLAIKDAS